MVTSMPPPPAETEGSVMPPVLNRRTETGSAIFGNLVLPSAPPMYRPFLALDEESMSKKTTKGKKGAAKEPETKKGAKEGLLTLGWLGFFIQSIITVHVISIARYVLPNTNNIFFSHITRCYKCLIMAVSYKCYLNSYNASTKSNNNINELIMIDPNPPVRGTPSDVFLFSCKNQDRQVEPRSRNLD